MPDTDTLRHLTKMYGLECSQYYQIIIILQNKHLFNINLTWEIFGNRQNRKS